MCGGSKDDLISEHISNLVPTSKTSCQPFCFHEWTKLELTSDIYLPLQLNLLYIVKVLCCTVKIFE